MTKNEILKLYWNPILLVYCSLGNLAFIYYLQNMEQTFLPENILGQGLANAGDKIINYVIGFVSLSISIVWYFHFAISSWFFVVADIIRGTYKAIRQGISAVSIHRFSSGMLVICIYSVSIYLMAKEHAPH